ncbi:MAG: PQQ-binding-like beta-propeller repeat protein [Phycisphaeraceae bacterium]|nr:PQQ-binding-like beta-propeller repeat protein [Phycisphaeraceae bacterium]
MISAIVVLAAPVGTAQTVNPVYVDDSTRTRDALAGLEGLLGAGNVPEAVRTLQDLLETEGARVIETEGDRDLFVDVRERVHAFLLARPELLAAYREAQEAEARRQIEVGFIDWAAQARWLTRAGLEASLRIAQRHIEGGRFEAARLELARAEAHPDASDPALAGPAAELAHLLARYLPRPEVLTLCERAAARASVSMREPEPIEWPRGAIRRDITPLDPNPPLNATELDRRPQRAVRLAPESARPDEGVPVRGGNLAAMPWIMACVVDDVVLANDGEFISAWDRFTLAMRWRLRPPPPDGTTERPGEGPTFYARQLMGNGLEDGTFVTAASGYALAATGLARAGMREGDPRLHAIEIDTGRLVWSVRVDSLDERLADSSIRGPAIVSGDTVVVCMRTFVQFRRLQSTAMVGLDLHTGELKWVRSLASAGTLPYRRPTAVADVGVLHEGVVYRVDELGTIVALEAETGRTVWLRRMLSVSGAADQGEPWAMAAPIIHDGQMVTLSPDHRDILRIDLATGAIVGSRGADVFGWPRYLIGVNGWLVAVNQQRVAAAPIDGFETQTVRMSPSLTTNGATPLVGRVVASGDRLLAPTPRGAVILDPAAINRPIDAAHTVELDNRGMLLAAPSQLLVVDTERIRSFLVWSEALERLRDEIEARPNDPLPSLALARLAARAGEWRLVTPAVDRCLDALDAGGPGQGRGDTGDVRTSVYEFTLDLVRRAGVPEGVRPEGAESDDGPKVPAPLGDELIARLGRAAVTPEQRVAHLFELGAVQERDGQHAQACETYQRVLDEPVLADELWTRGVASSRADLEAAVRVRRLVARAGGGVYDPFDSAARRERAALGDSPRMEDLRTLARRFPASSITPGLWLDVAHALDHPETSIERLSALQRALEAGKALSRAGAGADVAAVGRSARLLIDGLDAAGHAAWALRVLENTLAEFPGAGAALGDDLAARRAGLRDAALAYPALAVTGPEVRSEARLLDGRRVLRPFVGHDPTGVVVMIDDRREVLELWQARGDGFAMAWEASIARAAAVEVLSIDADRLVLFTSGRDGAAFECRSVSDGTERWRSVGFDRLFEPDPDLQARFAAARRGATRMLTPLDGAVRPDDLIVSHDWRTLVVVERSGRAAGLDMLDGRVLWSRRLPLAQAHDAAVRGPSLVVGGAFNHPAGPDSVQMTLGPMLLVMESRTGELVSRRDDASAPDDPNGLGEVRWVRLTPDGRALAGLNLSIAGLDAWDGAELWRTEGPAMSRTMDAWVDGPHLWVLGGDRGFRQVSLADGSMTGGALPTQGRTGSRTRVRLTRLESGIVLSSGRGIVLLDREGGLLGIDAIDRQDSLLPPAVGRDFAAMLDSRPRRIVGDAAYRLSVVNTLSAREVFALDLLLAGEPRGVMVVDGHALVGQDGGVLVLPMPPE